MTEENTIESFALHLANRAYLYRMFHIALGALPSTDLLRTLSSEEARAALRYLDGLIEGKDDAIRATIELFESLQGKAEDPGCLEALRSSYTRLFLVPGDSRVIPWESPYIGKETMLFQESTLDVRARYAEHGFAASGEAHFPEDHIAMMLDFLAHLSSRAYEAFADAQDAELGRILAAQGSFLEAHILPWLPLFCEDLGHKDDRGFFFPISQALLAWAQADKAWLDSGAARPL
ncbi:MAG: molecular chaperone TorD family protein [Coriobacteriaceae bacterium]|jgi:TorA maturation chaperone TorD|nr:molecular chaperone TorD family protein [Coriobacteriaceae bacterium]